MLWRTTFLQMQVAWVMYSSIASRSGIRQVLEAARIRRPN
jgi:hypothetical protein